MESYEEFVSRALARISFQAPCDLAERSPGERCLGERRPSVATSTVRFQGIPILPPLLSSESRQAMRHLRASALGVQRRRTRDQRSPRESSVCRFFISTQDNANPRASSHQNAAACAINDERAARAGDRPHARVDNEAGESPAKETSPQSRGKQTEHEQHRHTAPGETEPSFGHEEPTKDGRLIPTRDFAASGARGSNRHGDGGSGSNNSSSSSYSCLPSPQMSVSPTRGNCAGRPGGGTMQSGRDRFSAMNCSYSLDEPSPVLLASRLREAGGDGEAGRRGRCAAGSDAEARCRLEFAGAAAAANGADVDGNGRGGGRWPVNRRSGGNARAASTQTTPNSASGEGARTENTTPRQERDSPIAWFHSRGESTNPGRRETPPTFRALLARADSPGLRRAIAVVTAVGKGFLTRRLMRTEKLRHLKQTVLDTKQLLQSVQRESRMKNGVLSSQDAVLEARLNAQVDILHQRHHWQRAADNAALIKSVGNRLANQKQLRAALTDIHEIFHGASSSARARILHRDRELQKERRLREMEKAKGQLNKGPASQRPLEKNRQQKKPVVSRPTRPATANQQKLVRGRSGDGRPKTGISRTRNFVY